MSPLALFCLGVLCWCHRVVNTSILFLQARFRYPQKILTGNAIKRALATLLVAPVHAFDDHVYAIRVVWRRLDDCGLAHAWDSIVSQRRLCDGIVSRSPSLHLFVSCISGLFTNACRAGHGPTTRPVYPAVSYWVVFDRATDIGLSAIDLSRRLKRACPSAEVKDVKSSANRDEYKSLAADCGTLFVALKDHNSRFLRRKIFPSERANAKLAVAASSKYMQQMMQSVLSLKAAGLVIDEEVIVTHRQYALESVRI